MAFLHSGRRAFACMPALSASDARFAFVIAAAAGELALPVWLGRISHRSAPVANVVDTGRHEMMLPGAL